MTRSGSARTAARSRVSREVPGVSAATPRSSPRRLLNAVALVALIGAGCSTAPAEVGSGGGGNSATTAGPGSGPDSNSPGRTGGGTDRNDPADVGTDPGVLRELQEKLPEYARCMRENGVQDFPDPGADGTVQYQGDSDSVTFRSASEKCDDLLPEDPDRTR